MIRHLLNRNALSLPLKLSPSYCKGLTRISRTFVISGLCFVALSATLFSQTLCGETESSAGALQEHASTAEQPLDGLEARRLAPIRALVEQGIDDQQMAGAVVCIGRRDGIAYLRAFGHRQLEPSPAPMNTDTVFDLASLTKPLATGLSVMQLVDRGQLRLRDPASRYLPEFGNHGKEKITILQLLTHQSGLIPDNALADYQDGEELAWERIFELEPRWPVGSEFKYSDVGFQVLGKVVERVSGEPIDQYARHHIYEPLGLKDTGYNPPPNLAARAAATEQREGRWMVGEVHDPRAYLTGGVAGHAGLFSTAEDLAVLCQMILSRGQWKDQQILSPAAVRRMQAQEPVPGNQIRGLGWDKQSGYSSNRGETMSASAIGHGGFTGTAVWIDPELDLFVIFLSNRLHPDGKGSVNRLAGRIGTIAAGAILDPSDRTTEQDFSNGDPTRSSLVLTGADVLRSENYAMLKGKRVGLITNHTGQTSDGESLVELFHQSPAVDLKAIFSPEHGFAGKLDQALIDDETDASSGLPIYSLYGATRKPTAEMLADIDVLVFDIQDIGTRFYTYISTMGLAMEAAAEANISFVVLDRPNPLGGVAVEGPVLDSALESFVGFHPISLRHGMTVGELATMFNEEREFGVDLNVVRCQGWESRCRFDHSGLPWVSPSPNMRNLNEAVLYPGVGLIELTNISVGRGTDTPFEIVGAPWIDHLAWAKHLNQLQLPGIRFVPTTFTPNSSKYADELCHGVFLVITDHQSFKPVDLGWALATSLRDQHGDHWETKSFGKLLADEAALKSFLAGKSRGEIKGLYAKELESFKVRREAFLLY